MSNHKPETQEISLKLDEDRSPSEPTKLVISDANVTLWKERDSDAFFFKLFVAPVRNRLPRLKVTYTPSLHEIRDYSHMFFAEDNLMAGYQLTDFSGMPSHRIIKTPVYFAEHGQELNKFCRARTEYIEAAPLRAHIERAFDGCVYITPCDFFTKRSLLDASPDTKIRLYGLWLFGRIPPVLPVNAGRLDFRIQSKAPIDYLRLQIVLPPGIAPADDECTVSANMFKIALSSNPRIGRPGWTPLAEPGDGNERFIATYYSIEKPVHDAQCRLVSRKIRHPVRRLIVHNNHLEFILRTGKVFSLAPARGLFVLSLICIVYYQAASLRTPTTLQLTKIYNATCPIAGLTLPPASQDDVSALMKQLVSALALKLQAYGLSKECDKLTPIDIDVGLFFTVFTKLLGDRSQIDMLNVKDLIPRIEASIEKIHSEDPAS